MPANAHPPTWGPGYDERDLETLLSGAARGLTGEEYGTPDLLRPVAGTLAALLAPPVRGELAGEAAARASFRALAADPMAVSWPAAAEPGIVPAQTEVLSLGEGGRRLAARHRRRRGTRVARWPAAVVTAAAALIVLGVTLTGRLGGSIPQHPNPGGQPAGASAPATGIAPSSSNPGLEGGAEATGVAAQSSSAAPTAPPSPRGSAGPCPRSADARAHDADSPRTGAGTPTYWVTPTATAGGGFWVGGCHPYRVRQPPAGSGPAPAPGPTAAPSPAARPTPSPAASTSLSPAGGSSTAASPAASPAPSVNPSSGSSTTPSPELGTTPGAGPRATPTP